MYHMKFKKLFTLIPFLCFLLLFLVGIALPLDLTPQYGNYTSRIWNWTEIAIALTAAYYIIRSKVFDLKQVILSLLLGGICLVALYRDSRSIDIIQSSICVAVAFYGACRLFDQLEVPNRSLSIGIAGGTKAFLIGAAISIPLALLNVLYFSFQSQINMQGFAYSAISALKPAVAEEVIFRYFLLAYAYHLLHGKVSKRFFTIYVYLLMVIPHSLLHLPDLFLISPINAIVMLVLTSVFFGFPMSLLMKWKNLQMAIGMHWFIDFTRFFAGF